MTNNAEVQQEAVEAKVERNPNATRLRIAHRRVGESSFEDAMHSKCDLV
jgi:hypothetical protein